MTQPDLILDNARVRTMDPARDFAGSMQLLRKQAACTDQDSWVQGQGFNESDWPENRLPLRWDLDQAVATHTSSPARAYNLSRQHGAIRPGAFADLAVLDRDLYACDPVVIAATRVAMPLFNGRIVHEQPALGEP